jgi:cell division septation protein DedD
MATVNARSRRSSGPGKGQWIALGLAALVILGLTFTLGLLVGRQWARPLPPAAVAESAKKSISAARRSGLAEGDIERPPGLGEKLTFYQTLTAPLKSVAPAGSSAPAHRPEAQPKPQAAPVSAPVPAPPLDEAPPTIPGRAAPSLSSPPAAASDPGMAKSADREGAGAIPGPPQMKTTESQGSWTIQVAAFKARAQAERLQAQLMAAGFDAYLAEKGGEGQTQFRVRVGSFKTREDAARAAERVKAERSPAAFVTTR